MRRIYKVLWGDHIGECYQWWSETELINFLKETSEPMEIYEIRKIKPKIRKKNG
jgi:hypothetical protein